MIEVQVKAASFRRNPNWLVNNKAQQLARSDREWFVFVALAEEAWGANRAYVLPRDHVSAAAWITHQHWLTDPAVLPGKRNTEIDKARVHADKLAGYESRWDLLEAPATAAPVLLPPDMRELAIEPRVGLPKAHPWNGALPEW